MTAAFLWSDLGWLTLRLCRPTAGDWSVFASASCGPWNGDWCVRHAPDRAELAQWMAALDETSARDVLLDHPPFAQAHAA